MILNNALQVIVTQKQSLTSDITLFRLQAAPNTQLPLFTAGAHIEVQITPELTRAYSLCSDPALASTYYEIAVKREDHGRGGSIAMHDTLPIGSTLSISPPQNYFPLIEQASHHLLIAGGIGLTPMIAMAHTLSAAATPFTLVVCATSEAQIPFLELLQSSNWPIHKYTSGREHIDISNLVKHLPDDLHLYCCGPNGLIEQVRQQSLSLPDEQFHKEHFTAVENTDSPGVELYLKQSNIHVSVAPGTSMISALRQAGIEVESVCEQGICGSCVVPWQDGTPIHNDQCLEADEQTEYLALCCAGCRSPSLTLEL